MGRFCWATILCLVVLGGRPVLAAESDAEHVLRAFLASEQAAEMQLLANCLETFNLEQPQIERLIAAARSTTSEERQNLLWHALRQTRSTAAREYLQRYVVEDCDHISRVRYLNSLTNLAPFDVPLLIALFQGADKAAAKVQASPESAGKEHATSNRMSEIREDDLRVVLLRLATLETSALIAGWPSLPDGFREIKLAAPYMITARRQEQAKQAQGQLLKWIARKATSEDHRLAAILPAYRVLDAGEQRQLSPELLAAAKSPEERVRLYPLLLKSYGIDLVPHLVRDDLSETDKVGILQALHEHGSSYGYSVSSVSHGIDTYTFVSKYDASPRVRAAAETLLKRLSSK